MLVEGVLIVLMISQAMVTQVIAIHLIAPSVVSPLILELRLRSTLELIISFRLSLSPSFSLHPFSLPWMVVTS
jgi:hypothetical protein